MTIVSNSYSSLYGHNCYTTLDIPYPNNVVYQYLHIENKAITKLYKCNESVYIDVVGGKAALLIGQDPDYANLHFFSIKTRIEVFPNFYFTVIPITDACSCYFIATKEATITCLSNQSLSFQKSVTISSYPTLNTYNIETLASNTQLTIPTTSYYQLYFIIQGHSRITSSQASWRLHTNDLVICSPNDTYHQQVIGNEDCTILSISFAIPKETIAPILNQVIHCNDGILTTIKKILTYSLQNSPFINDLLVCHLQEVILSLLHMSFCHQEAMEIESINSQERLLHNIIIYIHKTIYQNMTIEELCRHFSISRSTLQSLFKAYLHTSPKSYIIKLKLDKSKELIRENHYNISEIADQLGFSSVHYFSRIFKQHCSMSPSEFARTSITN